jgi:hypothetical protein
VGAPDVEVVIFRSDRYLVLRKVDDADVSPGHAD